MSQIPDLVRDSELDTRFHAKYVSHRHHDTSLQPGERSVVREEYWKRERLVGGGAYGRVWLERCLRGERGHNLRAVKEIGKSRAPHGTVNFSRELEAMAKFSHQKYVRCFVESFGWYETADALFIAMEYFPHGDLGRYLTVSPPLPEAEAQQVNFQLIEGLAFLHNNGFVHRDLKPSNILVKSRPPELWWVKIGDFGISKRMGDGTALSSTLKGTLGYMPPELHGFVGASDCFSDDAQAAARAFDMWSLGEIGFQMLTKEATFRNMGMLFAFVQQPDLFPSDNLRRHHVSDLGVEFIQHLMKPQPNQRMRIDEALVHLWTHSWKPPSPRPPSIVSLESPDLLDEMSDPDLMGSLEPSGRWSTVSFSAASSGKPDSSDIFSDSSAASDGRQNGHADLTLSVQNRNKPSEPGTALPPTIEAESTRIRMQALSPHGTTGPEANLNASISTSHEIGYSKEPSLQSPDMPQRKPLADRNSRLPKVFDGSKASSDPQAMTTVLKIAGSDHLNHRFQTKSPIAPEGAPISNQQHNQHEKLRERALGSARLSGGKELNNVPLFRGHMVFDMPHTNRFLESFSHVQPPERDEFTHSRYTAVTCRPEDFKHHGYALRPELFARPRSIELVLAVTFDVLPLASHFAVFLAQLFEAMTHLVLSKTDFLDASYLNGGWKNIVLVMVVEKLNDQMRDLFASLGLGTSRRKKKMPPVILLANADDTEYECFDDGNIYPFAVDGEPVTAHIHEYTTQKTFIADQIHEADIYERAVPSDIAVQLILCRVEGAVQGANPEAWLEAIKDFLDPRLCIRYKLGKKIPHVRNTSICETWKAEMPPAHDGTKTVFHKSNLLDKIKLTRHYI